MNTRPIKDIIDPQFVMEGAGVLLRRSISPRVSNYFDPFLLFDHFAFNDPQEDPIPGFPMHPHRGIETVTYILKGSVNHRDSLGNSGFIGPGDIQWMTAGGGIMHEEMPRRDSDGIIDGFQLWINLPAQQKMAQPRYREVNAADIPIVKGPGWQVRVVAGEISGVRGPVEEIAAKPIYLEVALDPNAEFSLPVPNAHTVLAYVFNGKGESGNQDMVAVKLVTFGDGDQIEIQTHDSAVRLLLLAGAPFGEPIVPYGPFVMNTQAEIQQALTDLRNGTFVKS
jgi:redox-sensitive bicupin YhaK (pirin superfamily)